MGTLDIVEDLIPRAEIFRSKLIEYFNLLESITSSTKEIPKYYSSEVSESSAAMNHMLKESPHALVKFHVYSNKVEATYHDRRLNRVKTKNAIPFGPWARMIISNQYFHNFMLFLILTNSIVLGIQAGGIGTVSESAIFSPKKKRLEIAEDESEAIKGLKLFLDIFDYISMMLFILEIVLKWVDEFWQFWRNGWNNFDFFVTVMSLAPELIKAMSGKTTKEVAVVAENMRVFRILRSLKMVSRFAQLRIIVLTILKAFKSMAFILTLLTVFMYIFAVAGTVMFSEYSKSGRTDLTYTHSFSSLGQSFSTLFQLFTLDQWFKVLDDLSKVSNGPVTKIYIILWICIGSFIFRNIFAGIMVMNFQNIRSDFANQCNEREQELEDENREMMLEVELAMQQARASMQVGSELAPDTRRKSSVVPDSRIMQIFEDTDRGGVTTGDVLKDPVIPTLGASISTATLSHGKILQKLLREKKGAGNDDLPADMDDEMRDATNWNSTVRLNFQNFTTATKETLWPRDTLFKYFQLMESLQDNLAERRQLQRLSVLAISNMHDTKEFVTE